jgi:histidinol-phosphate aminotransferase
VSKFWSPVVSTLKPYVAGEQPRIDNLVKLNTNENPYGPSPKAILAMQAAVADSIRLYPDPTALELRQAIARTYGVGGRSLCRQRLGRSAGAQLRGTAEA